jgi:hypothetical protein
VSGLAATILTVTGRYPRGLYDFILGLNRWCCGSPPMSH